MSKKVYGNIMFCYPNDQRPKLINFLHKNGYSGFTNRSKDVEGYTVETFEFHKEFTSKIAFKKYLNPFLTNFKSIDSKISYPSDTKGFKAEQRLQKDLTKMYDKLCAKYAGDEISLMQLYIKFCDSGVEELKVKRAEPEFEE